MTTRAKFTVSSITNTLHWDRTKGNLATVKLVPVAGTSPENQQFFDATPCGEINIGVLNPEAAKQFELGKSYYVDFTLAPDDK